MISSYFIFFVGDIERAAVVSFEATLAALAASLANFDLKMGPVAATMGLRAFCFCTRSLCITANGSVHTPRSVNVVNGMTAHQGNPVKACICSTDSVSTLTMVVGSTEKLRRCCLKTVDTAGNARSREVVDLREYP